MRRFVMPPIMPALRTALPFVFTGLMSLFLALLIVPLVLPSQPPVVATVIETVVVPATPEPSARATIPPDSATATLPEPDATPPPATATIVVFPTDTISFELTRLQTELDTSNGYILMLKAASRLQEARLDLRTNNVSQLTSQLVVAQEDLDQARQLVPEPLKGTVQNLISDINYLLDDLSVRPEDIDARLVELWERTTSVVEFQGR